MGEITNNSHSKKPASFASILMQFLGSMNLAITLLVAVAIASVIGTVLLQNQAYNEYIVRFGSFWFEFFRTLGLYNVYSTWWFLAILGFLVTSTSVCIYHNAPSMLRDMRNYRLHAKEKSLRAFHHKDELKTKFSPEESISRLEKLFHARGYRTRKAQGEDHILLSGMKGAYNRIGYLFTHISIVVICIGGLMDGNLGLKLKEMRGDVVVLKEDMRVDKIPASSRLSPSDSLSFRGNRTIPEGSAINGVILDVRDGYVLQELPFAIEVKDFRIEYYPTGQPKSFESDLVIHDDALKEPLKKTISVNHPLIYRGYAIYQASFGDGGSGLTLKAWPLLKQGKPVMMKTEVFSTLRLQQFKPPLRMEISDFRMFNINPEQNKETGKKFRNWGPSFRFKLRNAAGEANEYINYMLPVERDGRLYFMSGIRKSLDDQFRYLRIPADKSNSIDRFMNFAQMLHDQARIEKIARASAKKTFERTDKPNPELEKKLVASLKRMVSDFAVGGLDSILSKMERTLSREQLQKTGATYIQALRSMLAAVYLEVLKDEGVDVSRGVQDNADRQFFSDAFDALSVLPNYSSPYYFQLADFNHVEATGLQITRSPGKNLVYLGCLMLIIGVFVMFYINHRRLWCFVKARDGVTEVIFAGSGNRKTLDFDKEFDQLRQDVSGVLKS
jgi:cytochrome c biogenesis protein